MALTEETIQDKIEVVGDYKAVHVRTATVIKKDLSVIAKFSGIKNKIYKGKIERK